MTDLSSLLAAFTLAEGEDFYWSPAQQTITYKSEALATDEGRWALLHEVAHAQLGHTGYNSDFELLQMEVAAWHHAEQLATEMGSAIDSEHIQDCLDTYRDWLHERSTCPTCATVCLQKDSTTYNCHNCHSLWQVSASRFCRPYRMKARGAKAPAKPDITFA